MCLKNTPAFLKIRILVENLLYFGFKDGKQSKTSKVSLHSEQCHAKLGPGQGLTPILTFDSMSLSLELNSLLSFPILVASHEFYFVSLIMVQFHHTDRQLLSCVSFLY